MHISIEMAANFARQELCAATKKHGPFRSAHEGYAVIKEEVDELWDEIKKKSSEHDSEKLKEEATQVAAMALRFLVDLCGNETVQRPHEPTCRCESCRIAQ